MPTLPRNNNIANNPDSIYFASKMLSSVARENMRNPIGPDVAVLSQMSLDSNIAVNYNSLTVTYQEIQTTVYYILDAVKNSRSVLHDYGNILSGPLNDIINQFKLSTVKVNTSNQLISSGLIPNQPRIATIGGSRKGSKGKVRKLGPVTRTSTGIFPEEGREIPISFHRPLAPSRRPQRFTSKLGDTAMPALTYRSGDALSTQTGFTGIQDSDSDPESSSDEDSSIPSTFRRNFGSANSSLNSSTMPSVKMMRITKSSRFNPDSDPSDSDVSDITENSDDDDDDGSSGNSVRAIGTTPRDVNVVLKLLNRLIQLIRKADYIFTGMINTNINMLNSNQISELGKIKDAMNLIWKIFTTPNGNGIRLDFLLRLLVQYSSPMLITLHQVIEAFVQDLIIGINKYKQNEPQQGQLGGAGRYGINYSKPMPTLNNSIKNFSAKYLL